MSSEIDLFREYLKHDYYKYEVGQPTSEEEITAFEIRYGIKFPPDIREYFLKINGVYLQGCFITIGALSEWRPLNEYEYSDLKSNYTMLGDPHKYFRFGNYDVFVWDWLIELHPDSDLDTPIIVTCHEATRVADNFSDFMRKYRENEAESLLGP